MTVRPLLTISPSSSVEKKRNTSWFWGRSWLARQVRGLRVIIMLKSKPAECKGISSLIDHCRATRISTSRITAAIQAAQVRLAGLVWVLHCHRSDPILLPGLIHSTYPRPKTPPPCFRPTLPPPCLGSAVVGSGGSARPCAGLACSQVPTKVLYVEFTSRRQSCGPALERGLRPWCIVTTAARRALASMAPWQAEEARE